MNVLFDPNPFCFGSTSTMRAILDALPDASARVLATGPVHDLCGDLSVEALDTRDAAALKARPDLLQWADAYVAVSNNTSVETVCDTGLPLVFVDILFWMKRQRTSAMRRSAAYVIENYPGVDARFAEFPIPQAWRVGPTLRAHIVCVVPGAQRWYEQLLRREGVVDPRHKAEHRRWAGRLGTGARAAPGRAS